MADCGVMSAGLSMVTETPGRTAPVPSAARPKIWPVWIWAVAAVAAASTTANATTPTRANELFILILLHAQRSPGGVRPAAGSPPSPQDTCACEG